MKKMKSKFAEIKKEIEKILPNSPLDFEPIHSKLVLKYVLKLKPDADEALKIAALAHDIERAVTGITEKDLKDYSKIDEFKKEHSIRSSKIISDLMKSNGYDNKVIERVKYLVDNHEFGGKLDAEILKDADSLAFFDYNIPSVFKRNGRERVIEKIKFMYRRLSSKSRKLVDGMKFKDKEISLLVKEAVSQI
ncbi:MAG: DUF4202 family protein [Nanoarchaeota archaeon]|nr:DUF4202 family protein [Nanoarchaeota archaeon]